MPLSVTSLTTTAYPMSGGIANVAPRGPTYRITFAGTWAVGDKWIFTITSTVGDFTLGAGNITSLSTQPTYGRAVKNRVYLAIGTQFNFSELDDATGWEEQDVGAGFLPYNSNLYGPDTVISFSIHQGSLVVFARRSIQIWAIDADPALFALSQSLENTGTFASKAVQPLGELEIFYPSDTGVRSLRSRETTLNAFVNDLGTPIDALITAALSTLSESQRATAVGIVDPEANRYWLFLDTTIYVLSYFPSSKIIAWSTYEAKYQDTRVQIAILTTVDPPTNITVQVSAPNAAGASTVLASYSSAVPATPAEVAASLQAAISAGTGTHGYSAGLPILGSNVILLTPPAGRYITVTNVTAIASHATTLVSVLDYAAHAFVPQYFITYQGQVYARTSDGILRFGGTTNLIYDNTQTTVELPWLDMGTPTTIKAGKGIDAAIIGEWVASASMDPYGNSLEQVLDTGTAGSTNVKTDSTFDKKRYAFTAKGTHFKLKFVSAAANGAKVTLSEVVFKYMKGEKQ